MSGIECASLTGSIVERAEPQRARPGATSCSGTSFSLCSSSFERTIAIVSAPP